MRRSLLVLAVLAALAGARSPDVRADERPMRQVGLNRRAPWLTSSVSLRDLFGANDGERLRSGFVNRVVIRVELWPDGGRQPVARADRRAELLFDLWDERFRLQLVDRYGIKERDAATEREAIEIATALIRFDVAELSRLSPTTIYRLRFRADLNPLSEDLVNEVKRWLVRSPGQGRGGAGDSVFGSVVNIFVNPQIDESERQISFWSQPFRVGTP